MIDKGKRQQLVVLFRDFVRDLKKDEPLPGSMPEEIREAADECEKLMDSEED